MLRAHCWGAVRLRGNNQPIEPDPDNAGEGNGAFLLLAICQILFSRFAYPFG